MPSPRRSRRWPGRRFTPSPGPPATGPREEAAAETLGIAAVAGVADRITVSERLDPAVLADCDILTNSGHLRPITAEIIAKLPRAGGDRADVRGLGVPRPRPRPRRRQGARHPGRGGQRAPPGRRGLRLPRAAGGAPAPGRRLRSRRPAHRARLRQSLPAPCPRRARGRRSHGRGGGDPEGPAGRAVGRGGGLARSLPQPALGRRCPAGAGREGAAGAGHASSSATSTGRRRPRRG